MSYQVTARKWRPMVFDDVIGQTHVSDTLRNALEQNRLAHAFIFSGTRGCGKTTTARILARAVNCLNPQKFEPCNECEVCKEIIEGRSLDVIEIDGASNRGVDEIRNLRESVRYAPTRGKKKVYIIDEVHMLTKEAFNALLKTLEEPPPHVLFIFATTELHKVPATILSRCQRYDFRRIGLEEIVGRLKFIAGEEKITIDDDSLLIISKKGDGSMRDAQSIFDQVVSFCGTTITAKQVGDALNIVDQELYFRVSDLLRAKDTKGALDLVKDVVNSGFDIKEFVSGLTEHYRNMLIAKTTNTTTLIEESEVHRKRYAADVASLTLNDILRILKVTSETESTVRFSAQPRFKLEVMMVQLTKMDSSVKIDDLLNQIDDLKKKLQSDPNIAFVPASTPVFRQETADHDEMPEPPPEIMEERSAPVPASRPAPRPTVQQTAPRPATKPIEAPRQRFAVQDSQPKYTLSSSTKKSADDQPKESVRPIDPVNVTMADVQQHWSAIVDAMRMKKISVGTILGETTPFDLSNGTLQIACGDDFHCGTLVRNKEVLADTVNSILNSRLRIEPIIKEEGLPNRPVNHTPSNPSSRPASFASAATPDSPVANSAPATAAAPPAVRLEEHPLVKKLYSEFGAEKM
ncbi:MAG: DNA polymerase III subunit gamma/tau [Bacteroidetes bacterium]|nr:DNA polymerase III subunit gamma/tau [Bacteroidota bacterium]